MYAYVGEFAAIGADRFAAIGTAEFSAIGAVEFAVIGAAEYAVIGATELSLMVQSVMFAHHRRDKFAWRGIGLAGVQAPNSCNRYHDRIPSAYAVLVHPPAGTWTTTGNVFPQCRVDSLLQIAFK